MGHDYLDYRGRSVVFRDGMLNLVRCIMDRMATDSSVFVSDTFRVRLRRTLAEFDYVCNGVFTDFKLDELLRTEADVREFLGFLDCCASFVVERGPILPQQWLNDLVGDSDDWPTAVDMIVPLLGIGRIANLVSGAEACVGGGVLSVWAFDDFSPRMKQERLSEHRRQN